MLLHFQYICLVLILARVERGNLLLAKIFSVVMVEEIFFFFVRIRIDLSTSLTCHCFVVDLDVFLIAVFR